MGLNVVPRASSSRFMISVAAMLSHLPWMRRKTPMLGKRWERRWTAQDLSGVSSRYVDHMTDYSLIIAVINALGEFAKKRGTHLIVNHVLRGDQPGTGNQLISRHHLGLAVDFHTESGGTVMRQHLIDDLRREGFNINYFKHYASFTHIDFAAADDLIAQYKSHLSKVLRREQGAAGRK